MIKLFLAVIAIHCVWSAPQGIPFLEYGPPAGSSISESRIPFSQPKSTGPSRPVSQLSEVLETPIYEYYPGSFLAPISPPRAYILPAAPPPPPQVNYGAPAAPPPPPQAAYGAPEAAPVPEAPPAPPPAYEAPVAAPAAPPAPPPVVYEAPVAAPAAPPAPPVVTYGAPPVQSQLPYEEEQPVPYYAYPPKQEENGSEIEETEIFPAPEDSGLGEESLASVQPAPVPGPKPDSPPAAQINIPPNTSIKVQDNRGQYSHGYKNPDGTEVEETGHLISTDNGWEYVIAKEGSYSYKSPEGIPIVVRYIADEKGFRILSTSFAGR